MIRKTSAAGTPMEKAEMIRRSIRCFVKGLIGLLPGIGLPFAVSAMADYWRLARRTGPEWNPAERYAAWGSMAADLGLIMTLILTLLVAIALA